ncbi:17842_t:CDS:2, partial [Funneliformis caledonium]
SFYNINRNIELELLRIVQNYSHLDEISHENQHFSTCLSYIATRKTVGSLATHEDFDLKDYSEFLMISKDIREMVGIGSEPFLGTFLKPMKKDINLPQEILILLKVKQFGRLRLEATIFSLAYSK